MQRAKFILAGTKRNMELNSSGGDGPDPVPKRSGRGCWSSAAPTKCTFPGCTHQVKRKSYMEKHLRLHEAKLKCPRPHRCTFGNCEYSASLKSAVSSHVKKMHTPGRTKQVECPLCPKKFYSKSQLQKHIGSHVRERRFKCDHCPFRTHLKKSLEIHVTVQHDSPIQFSCSFPGCSYSSCYPSSLKSHARIHGVDPLARRPLACSFPNCDYRTAFSASLTCHVRARHNPDREKIFACPLCPQSFYEKRSLQLHIDFLHTKEKSYTCPKCPYTTHRRYDLQRHSRRLHKEGPVLERKFKCEKCDFGAFQRFQFDLHVRTKHSEERRLKCEHPGCNFRTNYPNTMKKHVLNHADRLETQFPISCAFSGCDFRRRIRTEMIRHERNHENSMSQFKCKMCPMRVYPDSKSLFFHKSLNHARRIYKCSICDYAVSYKSVLENHIRQRHHHSTRRDNQMPSSVTTCNTFVRKRYQ